MDSMLEAIPSRSSLKKTPGVPAKKFKVVCMECGKKFTTKSALPTCPKCKGSDIEVA